MSSESRFIKGEWSTKTGEYKVTTVFKPLFINILKENQKASR